jgi:hypothetical protein
MPPLRRDLRKVLESTVVTARTAAENAARAALSALAVGEDKPFDGMSEPDRALRRALRAKERQLGGPEVLVAEIAYQHWHRMLFARFLVENGLLIHPEAPVGVSLEEVSDLAREEGEPDPWVLAARYAAQMLPAIFREGDPALVIRFAPEGRKRLEDLLASVPASVFTSEDALGWVYQFWQSEEKKRVNKAGDKIGAAELPAVTQLFTEDYMVRFLLENSLGAWWAGRHPDSPLLEGFTYLRLTGNGTPAAGTFEGWPDRVAEVTVMDPCCGSGHFLTVAFEMLTAMRMEEEELPARQAGDAVIADNLFGLELDPRCTQIAAFALALSAWRAGDYRELPTPNIACSGIGVAGQLPEWKKIAEGNKDLENALTALHEQFRNAPELGSLIDPRRATEEGQLFSVDYERVAPLLQELLLREEDPEAQVAGWAAEGIARAASLLAQGYTLVATNVPYLGRQFMVTKLRAFCEEVFPDSKADLATVFLERIGLMARTGGSSVVVLPQNWLFLSTYSPVRCRLLATIRWLVVARLGPRAFEEITGEVVQATLCTFSYSPPRLDDSVLILDALHAEGAIEKSEELRSQGLNFIRQERQRKNPDCAFAFEELEELPLLETYVSSHQGLITGDNARFRRCFWELSIRTSEWDWIQLPVNQTMPYGGRHEVVRWEQGKGALAKSEQARVQGLQGRGRSGVAVSRMGGLPAALYGGDFLSDAVGLILPRDPATLPPIWAFCSSSEYGAAVRRLNTKVSVANATLAKVPFDLEHWTKVAAELYPEGLPQPYSNDPTQWLFKGDPTDSTEPLQVAVACLLGYRWPDQELHVFDELADTDGVVSISALAGEQPAAERLRALFERVWGQAWAPGKLDELLSQAGAAGKDLDTWLRDAYFASHAKLFHNRPFIWHIWDGRKDGFGVLVNYHRLDRQLLDRITHTLLGSWIEAQRDQVRNEVPGAEARLVAAQELQRKLELIAEGEPPYDIYVRWRPLAEQPIGWDPDVNDGVRLNVRPFVTASVLRSKFSVKWDKDRGKDADGSERLNDLHYSRAEKEAARAKAGR